MGFNEIDIAMGGSCSTILGEAVTYRRLAGGDPITAQAEIDLSVEVFGEESGVMEYRSVAVLQRADVGEPTRGDTIETVGGTTYAVQDVIQDLTDKVDVAVTIK